MVRLLACGRECGAAIDASGALHLWGGVKGAFPGMAEEVKKFANKQGGRRRAFLLRGAPASARAAGMPSATKPFV